MPKINIGIDEFTDYYFSEGKREHGEYIVEISDKDLKFLKNANLIREKAQHMLGELKAEAREHIRRNSLITRHYPD